MTADSNWPRQHVAAGSYAISRADDLILEAYLGSCVGVTLCDPEAELGGLVHFLLPKPTGFTDLSLPERYASTGLPLFIQALCAEGAQKERLLACMAGGGLVGAVSDLDLELDIGGRTTEVVQTILHQEEIPIFESETGGYFGYRLNLNVRTWESVIMPMRHLERSDSSDFEIPAPSKIDQAIARVRPIPQTALKIIRMIDNERYDMQDIAGEVNQDQILSAQVIKLCNSAFIGLRTKIDSVDRALCLLGEKMILHLIVSASIERFFPQSSRGYSLCKGGLFHHALSSATVADELARFTRRVPSDIAYTAGLLHDIGMVVLDQFMAPADPLFYRRIHEDGIEFCEAEKEKLGIDHTEAGRRLAERWAFPENLVDMIMHHHRPEESTVNPELTNLICLTDWLLSRFQMGMTLENMNTEVLASRLGRIGLTPNQLPILIDLIPQKLLEASLPAPVK